MYNGLGRHKKTYVLDFTDEIQEIADKIKNLLDGKRYMWVEAYEYLGWRPGVRFDQKIHKVSVGYSSGDNTYGWICVNDTYGVWDINTSKRWKNTIAFFDCGIEINQHTPEGKEVWWQIYIMDDED